MTIDGFAVDLGGTKIAAARVEQGVVVGRVQRVTDGAADLPVQLDTMELLLAELGFQHGERLGVAVAGRVDRDGNWHAVNTATLRAIVAAPLGTALKARFGEGSLAINDAAAAALAEYRLGAGRGSYNFAYVTVSTGVGGGLVLNGRLVDSGNGLAGHIGFTSSPFGKSLCGSRRMGTVESVAGGRAIAVAAGLPDAKAVFESDPEHPAIRTSAQAVARLIADLTAILGLDRVAVGGSIGLAPGYLDKISEALATEPELFCPMLTGAELGNDSGLVGALLRSLNPA